MQSDISSMYMPFDRYVVVWCVKMVQRLSMMSLFLYYNYGDMHLSCIGNDNFGVLTQNVFDVLFVIQTYRSFLMMRHTFPPSG